jgi:hypothetical protein
MMQGRSTASSAEPNVRFWPILLKKSQVEARRKSAQIAPTSEIDD